MLEIKKIAVFSEYYQSAESAASFCPAYGKKVYQVCTGVAQDFQQVHLVTD